MKEEISIWQLKYEDFNRFEVFEQSALAIPFVKESVEYLLTIRYKFENYVTEKIYNPKKKITYHNTYPPKKENKQLTGINYNQEPAHLEQLKALGILDERESDFFDKLNNLIRLQMNRMRLHQEFPNINIRNQISYSNEDQIYLTEKEKKENLIWLGSRDQLELLLTELIDKKYHGEKEKLLGLFCDMNGRSFTRAKKEKTKWHKHNSELAFLIRLLISGSNKLLSAESIWVKTSKCFNDNNGKTITPKSLSVSSQKGNPKTQDELKSIVEKVKSLKPTE